MPIPSMRRRLRRLETEGPFRRICHYSPLTPSEIDTIAHRLTQEERLTREEVERIGQHSPVIQGEVLITAYRGIVTMKRYVGLDLAEL
jgi:hypothetical protein